MQKQLLTSCLLVLFCASFAETAKAGSKRFAEWATISHPRTGFQIAYPGNVFTTAGGKVSEDGQVFVSHDGAAKLIVGAFANESNATMEEYRAQLLSENYAGANIDFAPVRANWFIVSGTRGAMHFYERVSFTCDGRLINSWALLYPASARAFYDRAVEAIARTYSPGAGQTGHCDGL